MMLGSYEKDGFFEFEHDALPVGNPQHGYIGQINMNNQPHWWNMIMT